MGSYKQKNYIGKRLSVAIKDKGITITQFAKDVGISRELVTKYLNNSKHPSDETLKRIADYFSLPVEYFLEEPYDVNTDESLVEIFSSFIKDKLDEHQINNYFKSSIKAANYAFEKSDSDSKTDLTLKIFEAAREARIGPELINITSSEESKYINELSPIQELYMYLYNKNMNEYTEDEIKKRITSSLGEDRIVERKDWDSYFKGFTDGINVLMPYKQKVLNELKASDFKFTFKHKEKVIEGLSNCYYKIKEHEMYKIPDVIDSIIVGYQNETDTTLVTWKYKDTIILALEEISEELFPIAVKPLLDLKNDNTDLFIDDLLKLKNEIERQVIIASKNSGH